MTERIDADRLINWARWLRTYHQLGQADSIEGNFREKSDDAEDRTVKGETGLTKRGRLPAPNFADAWDVEVACRLLPIKYHVLLKLRYVWRLSDDLLAKSMRERLRIRMSASDLDAAEGMAIVLLSEALGVPAVIRMERAQAIVRLILATEGAA